METRPRGDDSDDEFKDVPFDPGTGEHSVPRKIVRRSTAKFQYSADIFALQKMYAVLPLGQQVQQPPSQEGEGRIILKNPKAIQQEAIDVLLECIKAGQSRYLDCVTLLVNYNSEFEEDEKKLLKQKESNEKEQQIVERQRSRNIFATAVALLILAKEIIKHYEIRQANVREFHTWFIDHLNQRSKATREDLKQTVIEYTSSHPEQQYIEYQELLKPLRIFWPETLDNMEGSFFKINKIDEMAELLKRIDEHIKLFKDAQERANRDYCDTLENEIRIPYKEAEDAFNQRKRVYRDQLIDSVLATKQGVKKAGIPIRYRNELDKDKLKRMAGSVDTTYQDQEGCNLTLLALLYENTKIYTFLKNNRGVRCDIKDKRGRNASLYSDLTQQDLQIRTSAKQKIQEVDYWASDELLRKIRLALISYMESWEQRDIERESRYRHLGQYNIFSLLIQLLHLERDFQARKHESGQYLALIDRALNGEVFNVYGEMKKILQSSDRGALNQSELHKRMKQFLKQIVKKEEYENLINPSDILKEQLQETEVRMEEKMKEQERRSEEKMRQLEEKFKKMMKDKEKESSEDQEKSSKDKKKSNAQSGPGLFEGYQDKPGKKEEEPDCHSDNQQKHG